MCVRLTSKLGSGIPFLWLLNDLLGGLGHDQMKPQRSMDLLVDVVFVGDGLVGGILHWGIIPKAVSKV